jgi:glycosyltransferase involved in cell wall biosynthesis
LVEELIARGWDVTVLAEQFLSRFKSGQELRLRAFFRREPWTWLGRIWEIWNLFRLTVREPRPLIIVQGDLPRITYVLLQRVAPLMFIRQDGILTCPGNNRFLRRSRSICAKPAGFSCLLEHRTEGCMGQISLWRRAGRVVLRIRDRILLRCIRHFVTSSQYLGRIHGRPARVLYPPLMTGQRDGVRPGTSALHARDMHRLVFCGRLEQVKGAGDVISILSLMPKEYHLEILGDGPERERLARLVDELELTPRVAFRGRVDGPTRDRVLASAGVLLMPSLCDEAFGMAGIEALAQGTPVVAYDVGGISEWCRDRAGVLAPCGDVQAAATAVREMCEDAMRWTECSCAARRVAELFAQGRFAREFNAALDETLGNPEILKS